jgi:hypothetical protein
MNPEVYEFLIALLSDVVYLEARYPDIWSTDAGYTLQPRILELRALLKKFSEAPLT